MHSKYASQGLEILAFLGNQLYQEPCGQAEIHKFCDKVETGFRVMENANMNPPDERSVYSLLRQDDQRVRCNFHSKFLVACRGERCTISMFDGVMPKALNPDIEDAIGGLGKIVT